MSRPTTGLNLLLLYVAAHCMVQPRQKSGYSVVNLDLLILTLNKQGLLLLAQTDV